MRVSPVYVFAADNAQVPVPNFETSLVSSITPANSPRPLVDPPRPRSWRPATLLVNLSNPVPACSRMPVETPRLTTRSVVSPAPVYRNVAAVCTEMPGENGPPKSIVPSAAVVGAPRLLLGEPPTTLLIDDTLSVPELIETLVVNVLSPDRIQVPVPSTETLMLLPPMVP